MQRQDLKTPDLVYMLIDIHQSVTSLGTALQLFLLITLLSFITANAAMMFQWFQLPNMIFYPLAVLTAKIASKGEVWRHLMRPLGRCRYCNGIWITMYAFLYIFGFDLLIVLSFALNWFFVYIMSAYIVPELDPQNAVDQQLGITFKYEYTPWSAMLKTYAVMGVGYAIIYGVIPILI